MDPPDLEPDLVTDTGADELTGRYAIQGELGRGGMGAVLLVIDRRLDREVALKRMNAGEASEAEVQRFLQEARLTAQLDHPNIPPVHDVGTGPDRSVFFTMKRVRGRTLAEVVRKEKPSLHERLDVYARVCDAVAFAHSEGIVHRDLKPNNVMIGTFGQVYVLDWGIAKRAGSTGWSAGDVPSGDDSDLTARGTVLGTPKWMSPEQAAGDLALADARSDVYSLGAILYLLLTGASPFSGRADDVMDRVRAGRFAPPSQVASGVPPELEAVVLHAMALLPEDRYPTVLALRADVQRWREGLPVSARSYSLAERLVKWAGRHRRTLAAIGVTAGLVGSLLLVALVAWIVTLRATLIRATEAEADADVRLAESWIALADARSRDGLLDEAFELLRQARERLSARGRPEDAVRLSTSALQQHHPPPEVAWDVEGIIRRIQVSPAGRSVLVLRPGGVQLRSLPHGEVEADYGAGPGAIAWSGFVGERAVGLVVRPEALVVVDLRDGREIARLRAPGLPGASGSALLAADGRTVVVSDRAGARVWNLESQAALGPPIADAWVNGISDDGTRVVGWIQPGGRTAEGVAVWDVATGNPLVREIDELGGVLSPDGAWFALQSGDRLSLRALAETAPRWTVAVPRYGRSAFTADSRRLVVVGADNRMVMLDVATGDTLGARGTYGGTSGSQGVAAISGDGSVVATALGGRARVWTLEPGSSTADFRAQETLSAVAVSPDGELVLTCGQDARARLWDWRSGQLVRELVTSDAGSRDAGFSEDGREAWVAGRDGQVRVFDLVRGEQTGSVGDVAHGVVTGAALRGGELVAVHVDDTVEVYSWPGGSLLAAARGKLQSTWGVALSPDGATLAVAGRSWADPAVETWDLRARAPVAVADRKAAAYRLAYAPDGTLAVANHAGAPILYPAGPRGPEVLLPAVGEAVQSVAWSGDGTLLAVGAFDGSIRVYDGHSHALLLLQDRSPRSIVDVEFAPGTHTVLAGSGDGWIHPIDLDLARIYAEEHVVAADGTPRLDALARARRSAARRNWHLAAAQFEESVAQGGEVGALAHARARRGAGLEFRGVLTAGTPTADLWLASPTLPPSPFDDPLPAAR